MPIPMRAWAGFLLLATAALAVAPTAAADEFRLAFPQDFNTGLLAFDVPRFGAAAAQVRAQIDSASGSGDKDGTVTQEELAAFIEAQEQRFGVGDLRHDTPTDWTVDGRKAQAAVMDSIAYEGALGPTASEDPVVIRYLQTLYFTVGDVDRHQVGVRVPGLGGNMTMQFTIVAPPGFGVTDLAGLPGPVFVSDDRTIVEFPSGAQPTAVNLTMERGAQVATTTPAQEGSAGWSWTPVAILAAVVLALVLWMRRVH